MILATKEVITATLKLIAATTNVILITQEVITTILKVISATTKVILAIKEKDHSHLKGYLSHYKGALGH